MDTASCAIYASDDAGLEIVVRKNTIEDPADGRTEEVADKAEVCNRMSAHLFRILESRGLHTAFREEVTDTESLFRKAELIPILVTVHNYSAGSYPARTGLPEGTALASPSMDFHYLNRSLGNPMINGYDALAMKLVSESAVETIVKTAFRVNEVLSAYFRDLKMDLIDIEIRFGRIKEELVLTGDLSPDSMRLWDSVTHEKLDRDRFRKNLGNVRDAYLEVYRRLGIGGSVCMQ